MAKGKKFGGRVKGTKNLETIKKERVAAEIAARTIADARIHDKPLAKEVLDTFMHLFAGMAAKHQPLPDGSVIPSNRKPNPVQFEKWARLAVETATKLAPYQSPTFKAIMIAPPPDPGSNDKRRQFTLTIFEGGKPPRVVNG